MADAYIEAWGSTLEEAFSNAAVAFYDTMIDADKIEAKVYEDVEVSGHDLYELLYNWIEELIFLFETKGLIFSKFDIKISKVDDGWELKGKIGGERYSKDKHGSKTHVKAVTYHAMEIIEDKEGVKLRYLLDL